MCLAVFDIGGSAIKYGLWDQKELEQTGQFPTPATYEAFVATLQETIEAFQVPIEGVAISSPGAVNVDERQIQGVSAVPYLHDRVIFDELERALGLPVTIENDANCAGICEMAVGVGKNSQHAVFVVIGTGVGGAIFINKQLYKGAHLFGGEFGLMLNHNNKSLSTNGTVVNTAARYSNENQLQVTGKELFALKDQGDSKATAALEEMYGYLTESLYNIQVSLDPEMIILGGGISARPELTQELEKRLKEMLTRFEIPYIMPKILPCAYQNNANLIGAAINFETIKQLR